MRTVLTTFLLVVLVSSALCYDAPEEFRGIKFGTPFDSVKTEMTLLHEDDDGYKYYKRKDDKMSIGQADLSELAYVFHKGELSGVVLATEGSTNCRNLLAAFKAKFGEPQQENEYIERYKWVDVTSTIIMFYYNEHSKQTTASFIYSPSVKKDIEDTEKAAEDAKDDF